MESHCNERPIPVPIETIKSIFTSGRGKRYFYERENFKDEETGKEVTVYCFDYLKELFGAPAVEEISGGVGLKAEKSGDVVESWLGLLEVAWRTTDGVSLVIPKQAGWFWP